MTENLLKATGRDRRRHPRYPVEGVQGVMDARHAFSVVRMSLGGLMIRMSHEPSFNEVARVEVQLDRVVFRSRARIVYAGPDMASPAGDEPLYRVGLAFVDPTPEQQLRLERFIAREFNSSS